MTPFNRMMSQLRQAHRCLQENEVDPLGKFRAQVAAALRERFACSLATLWCLEGERGDALKQRMVCVTSLSDRPDEDLAGSVLEATDLGAYFTELLREGIFNSPDALNDPRLEGLRASYMLPNKVGALLDATARCNGEALGVICIEQRGSTRQWTRQDETDLRRAMAQIGLSLNRVMALTRYDLV